MLYVFVVIDHGTRRLVHVNVTAHPTADWQLQQLREVVGDTAPCRTEFLRMTGVTATVLWEITRHVLVWYFATLSQVSVVYGSLTTAIVVLLSLEIAAALLLFGAQVISEYGRLVREGIGAKPRSMRTDR